MKSLKTFIFLIPLLLGLPFMGVSAEEIVDPEYYFNDVENPSNVDEIKLELNVFDDLDDISTDDIYIVVDHYTGHETEIGDFLIIFGVDDSGGNTTTKAIYVRTLDITGPVITFPNANTTNIFVPIGSNVAASLPIMNATDGFDGDVSNSIEVYAGADTPLSEIDTSTYGEYQLTITASDSSGNITTLTTVLTVKDMTFPVIEGPTEIVKNMNYILDQNFFLTYFTATDNIDGIITNTLFISENEYIGNADVPGTYEIVVSVTDSADNTTHHTLTIKVKETMLPYLIIDDYYWMVSADNLITHQNFIDILKMIGDIPNDSYIYNSVYDTYSTSYRSSGYYENTFNLLSGSGTEYDRTIQLEVAPSNVNVIEQEPSNWEATWTWFAQNWKWAVPVTLIGGLWIYSKFH